MNYQDKNKEDLINELIKIKREYDSLKELYVKDINKYKGIEQELNASNQELQTLNHVISESIKHFNINTLLQFTLDEAIKICGLESGTVCTVSLRNNLELVVERNISNASKYELMNQKIKVGDCLCGECALTQKPLILKNRAEVLRYASREVQRGENIQFHASYPIVSKDMTVGVLCLFTYTDKKPNERTLKLIETLTAHISLIIENVNLYQNIKNQVIDLDREITKRKKAELLLKRRNKEIEIQNSAYQQINEELTLINLELAKSKERAEESDRLKTSFLQNMSHEIRTPMNAIKGFSTLLANCYDDKAKLEKYTEIIRQSSNDLLDIINDILDISKIESGHISVTLEECDLILLFEELTSIFTEYKKRLGKENIELSLSADCYIKDKVILTDKGKLKQIFINLISNAIKFTESGKVKGGCRPGNENQLLFYVSDTGIGIPYDLQSKIFDRFYQIYNKTSKYVAGTGLGLSIVRGLVNILGGELSLNSEPGKGSEFSFTIAYDRSEKLNRLPEDAITTDDEAGFMNKTILIVEDDKNSAEFLREILSGKNIKIMMAGNGAQAIDIALKYNIDIVLLDIRLPDINGYEVTRQLRGLNPNMVIIAQTAFASHEEMQNTIKAGCNAYISKPIDKKELFSLINKFSTETYLT